MENDSNIKAFFDEFATSILKHMEAVASKLANVDERLAVLEMDKPADPIQSKQEKETLAVNLEVATRRAMEEAGHNLLRHQAQNPLAPFTADINTKIAKRFFTNKYKTEDAASNSIFPVLEINEQVNIYTAEKTN